MIRLWLSVRELMGRRPPRARELDPALLSVVGGIHVDVHPNDPIGLAPQFVGELGDFCPELAYDLHFIDGRSDAARIVTQARKVNSSLRRVWSPPMRGSASTDLAASASGLLRGDFDTSVRSITRVLITAPPASRPLSERLRRLEDALRHVHRVCGPKCSVTLDRDITSDLLVPTVRERIDEVVVGKAILRAHDPVQAAVFLQEG